MHESSSWKMTVAIAGMSIESLFGLIKPGPQWSGLALLCGFIMILKRGYKDGYRNFC